MNAEKRRNLYRRLYREAICRARKQHNAPLTGAQVASCKAVATKKFFNMGL